MTETTHIFLVLMQTDKGPIVVACTELSQDPLFPDQVVLVNVQGMSWPFQGMFLGVRQWSVQKDAVIHWMVGPIQQSPEITQELLERKGQRAPGQNPTTPETAPCGPEPIRPISVVGR